MIDDHKLANIEVGQQRFIRDIFNALEDVAIHAYGSGENKNPGEKELRRLPHALRRTIDVGLQQEQSRYTLRQKVARGLIDYIASLSDREAYQVHAVLRGREAVGVLIRGRFWSGPEGEDRPERSEDRTRSRAGEADGLDAERAEFSNAGGGRCVPSRLMFDTQVLPDA